MNKILLACSFFAAVSTYAQNGPASIPYNYGFESTADGWTVVNGGTGESTWSYYDQIYGNISACEGSFYAAYMFDGFSAADAWLMSRKLQLSAGYNYSLTFKYIGLLPELTEKLRVTLGSEATITSQLAGVELYENDNITNTDWNTATINMTVPATGTYVLGFHCYSPADQGILAIDDLQISGVLSADDIEMNLFSVYPNPVESVVRIVGPTNSACTSIEISDMSGKTILSQATNHESPEIDLSCLASGTYFARITFDKGTSVKRIIKL